MLTPKHVEVHKGPYWQSKQKELWTRARYKKRTRLTSEAAQQICWLHQSRGLELCGDIWSDMRCHQEPPSYRFSLVNVLWSNYLHSWRSPGHNLVVLVGWTLQLVTWTCHHFCYKSLQILRYGWDSLIISCQDQSNTGRQVPPRGIAAQTQEETEPVKSHPAGATSALYWR